ncbi:MAG: glycosyltransferase family 1 protein [Chitinophagaceae bacterium]|nr:glycosyltransferase family 1 protein [Chitinophagaceae bacterium]
MNKELTPDLICFSHLRWNFVYQRPQHLLTRFSTKYRVFYIEEPLFHAENSFLNVAQPSDSLWVVVPHLQNGLSEEAIISTQQELLSGLFNEMNINSYWFWYYTPMALPIGNFFKPQWIVYDCMDELSSFKFAPDALKEREKDLLQKADIVFTGGMSLYEAKKDSHGNIYPFPSSIDKAHFEKARTISDEPRDQISIPHPRLGYYGVIDERMNLSLLQEVAEKKPDWNMIIIGPVVKIDPETLPKLSNIHYLGGKSYDELPAYLGGWDIAVIPFVLDESTRFISPTKTPEYLAGGKPVISTSIKDVVHPYGDQKLVHIADTADEFIIAATTELEKEKEKKNLWIIETDTFLSANSWDKTWTRMMEIITKIEESHKVVNNSKHEAYV